MCGVKAKLLPPQPFCCRRKLYASSQTRQNGSISLGGEREQNKKFRTGKGKLGDATRKVVVERVRAPNALTGISHQVRLLLGVARLLVHSHAHLLEVRAYPPAECHAMEPKSASTHLGSGKEQESQCRYTITSSGSNSTGWRRTA